MTDAHDEARRILGGQRDMLEKVTRRLLEQEVMEGDELRTLLGPAAGRPESPENTPLPPIVQYSDDPASLRGGAQRSRRRSRSICSSIAPRCPPHDPLRLPGSCCRMPSAIEALVDAAFWASVRREEGYVPKISLAFLRPLEEIRPLIFEQPLPLEPSALTRLAAAVERPGIHLGVWPEDGKLMVWGTTHHRPALLLRRRGRSRPVCSC